MLKEIKTGLDDQAKSHVEAEFNGSSFLRERLVEILEDEIKKSIKGEENIINYDTNDWTLKVADSRGYRRGLSKAIRLLSNK